MELLKLFLLCLIYIKIIAKYINFGHMSYSWGEIKTDKQGKYIACYDSVCPKKRKYIVLSETSKWTAEADQQKFEMSRNLKVINLIRTGGTGAQICVERGLGGIVVVAPVVVEVWMPSWWNDRVMLGLGVVPVLLLTMHGHVSPIGRSGCHGWGPRGSPSCERAPHVPRARRKYTEGFRHFDDIIGARARRKNAARGAYLTRDLSARLG
jgi:hypothetical protein